jgi:hypothetical protein
MLIVVHKRGTSQVIYTYVYALLRAIADDALRHYLQINLLLYNVRVGTLSAQSELSLLDRAHDWRRLRLQIPPCLATYVNPAELSWG